MRSGRRVCISFTPAASTNSDSAALYTEGRGRPVSSSIAWSAFSADTQIPFRPWPSSVRSLSLAVTTATFAPAF